MPHGGRATGNRAALRRNNVKKAARKKAARLAADEQEQDASHLVIPHITEDDLLAFQLSHFGDNVRPAEWFIDAETALAYDPNLEDDDLGYYEDGVKRTLTDDQIEMFRHSELEMIAREEKMRAEDERQDDTARDGRPDRAASPVSNASSVEGDLIGLAKANANAAPATASGRHKQQSRPNSRHYSTDPKTRSRTQDVPYDQRHKRKWEAFIDENDPIEGSLTHRRIVRELDEQHAKSVDLDY